MKSGKGNSLYEVLKSASRPGGDAGAPAEAPAPATAESAGTLQERLAAYKAAKLAAASAPSVESAAVEPAPSRAATTTLVLEPEPTPIPAPPPPPLRVVAPPPVRVVAPAPAPAPVEEEAPAPAAEKGPGERMIRLTYNTALFGGMVVAGIVFVAYAVGLHVGKSHVAADAPVVAAPRPPVVAPAPLLPPPPPPPPAPPKSYTLRVADWRTATPKERLDAMALSEELKKALEKAGYKNITKTPVTLRGEPHLALYMDKFSDLGSDAAKSKLAAMKTFKYKGGLPFEKAVFEELPGVR